MRRLPVNVKSAIEEGVQLAALTEPTGLCSECHDVSGQPDATDETTFVSCPDGQSKDGVYDSDPWITQEGKDPELWKEATKRAAAAPAGSGDRSNPGVVYRELMLSRKKEKRACHIRCATIGGAHDRFCLQPCGRQDEHDEHRCKTHASNTRAPIPEWSRDECDEDWEVAHYHDFIVHTCQPEAETPHDMLQWIHRNIDYGNKLNKGVTADQKPWDRLKFKDVLKYHLEARSTCGVCQEIMIKDQNVVVCKLCDQAIGTQMTLPQKGNRHEECWSEKDQFCRPCSTLLRELWERKQLCDGTDKSRALSFWARLNSTEMLDNASHRLTHLQN